MTEDGREYLRQLYSSLGPPPPPIVPPWEEEPDPLDGLTHCPTCHQSVASHERTISAAQATALCLMAWAEPTNLTPIYAAPLFHQARTKEGSQLEWWGLIAPDPQGRAGWWSVTARGRAFVAGHLSVVKYALIVFDRTLGHGRFDGLIDDDSPKGRERITIHDVKGFDLDALLASRRPYLRAVE